MRFIDESETSFGPHIGGTKQARGKQRPEPISTNQQRALVLTVEGPKIAANCLERRTIRRQISSHRVAAVKEPDDRTQLDYHRRRYANSAAITSPDRSISSKGAYKKKADRCLPVNINEPSGDTPGGIEDWLAKAIEREGSNSAHEPTKWDSWIHQKGSSLGRGSRLTPSRIASLRIGMPLSAPEHALLIAMLSNREAALSWEFHEIGHCHPDVAPPQRIRTIPHVPFQVKNFSIPRALLPTAMRMLRERIDRKVLEDCHGPYRNPWFLVAKKSNGTGKVNHRLINAATEMNRVTIKDACIPPNVEEFVEEFTGLACASVLDMFSGYDQVELAKEDRNLTGFQTPLGLLRMTTLPQGATNSVA